MIRFVIARHNDDDFKNYLEPSIAMLNVTTHEVRDNDGKKLSLTEKYNYGINDVLIDETFNPDDIVVFCHEDVQIKDPMFCEKINMVFNMDNIGLCGVIGCREFTKNGMWWANVPDKLSGHIIQENNGKDTHLVKGKVGFFKDIVAIDGLMFAVKGKLLFDGVRFDTQFKFHHYEIDFCLTVLEKKYDICIADILVKHKSMGLGSLTEEYKESKDSLIKKWSKYEFPITAGSFK